MRGIDKLTNATERLCRIAKENPCGMSDTAMGVLADGFDTLISRQMPNGIRLDRLAQYYGVTIRTIQRWRQEYPDFPKALDPYAKTLFFPYDDVMDWKEKHADKF